MSDATEPAVGRSSVERRIVSVVFADLVGFTPLSERLDAEDVAAIQDAYFSAVRDTIGRYGGVLEKFIGDAAMAVFGIPRTRDDDTERAVRAGLALVGAVEQLGARLGLEPGELELRVGVNSGEVVHATSGPDAGRVTGDTVNTAARLQAAAHPGTVLVGELTALAVEEVVELADVQPMTLKGKAVPVRARSAQSVRADRSRDDAMRGLHAPLLGRTDELTRLMAVTSGRLTLIAPPGVGKSRLLAELARRLEDAGVRALRGRVRPHAASPYEPVVELIAAAGGVDAIDEALERAGIPGPRREVLRREAMALLEPTGGGRAATDDLAAERETRFVAWTELLDALSGPATAWILEDVHWATPDLLAFLAHAASQPGNRRVYVSSRPSLLDTAPEWVAGGDVLDLPSLPPTEAAALVHALVGDALPQPTVGAIAGQSDGNPLFIEELLRTWISVGTLVRVDGTWRLTVEPDAVSLPPTVQAIYAAQLDDLPAAARLVARRASVVGRRFASEALAPLEVPDPDGGLAGLRHRALIDGPQPDAIAGSVYAYRHALLREVGYASLARAERSRLHAAIARWMERTAGERADAVAEAIGEHYAAALASLPAIATRDGPDRAMLAAAAAEWLSRGAEQALALAAHDRAIELLERAIELTPDSGPLAVAARRLRLGEVVAPVADLDRGIAEMRAALDAFAADLPASREAYARAAHALGTGYLQQIRFDEARDLSAAALKLIGPPDDASTARLLALHAFSRAAVGERDGLNTELERAEAIGSAIDDPELRVDLLVHRNMTSGETVDVEPSDSSELEAAAAAIGRWRTVVGAIIGRAQLTPSRSALAVLDTAAELCRAHGLTERLGWTHYARAEHLFVLGEWDSAVASSEAALDLAERYAYVRLGFRTWMALLPILAARHDTGRLARFDAWWSEAKQHFPSSPSPYGQVLLAAVELWRATTQRRQADPPPDELVDMTRDPDGNPHFQVALLTIAHAWLAVEPPRLALVRAIHEHFAAGVDEQLEMGPATLGILGASIAAAEGDTASAHREAQSAADAAAEADAPWWRLRALELSGDASGEIETLRARLGIGA